MCRPLFYRRVCSKECATFFGRLWALKRLEWIFIGEASNIRARLMEHLNEVDTVLACRSPTGFTFELCSPNQRIARQDALVRQFEPFCNRRPGYTTDRSYRATH